MGFLEADDIRPTFSGLFVTKLLVTQGTNRYQMKDMDMVFLKIPLSFLSSSGIDTTTSQSQAFFEIFKNAGNLPFLISTENQFLVPFFKKLLFKIQ